MKKDILEAFFTKYVNTKNVNPELENRIDKIGENLLKTLNDEEKGLFIEYADMFFQLIYVCSAENLKQGFWLGCEFMRELAED